MKLIPHKRLSKDVKDESEFINNTNVDQNQLQSSLTKKKRCNRQLKLNYSMKRHRQGHLYVMARTGNGTVPNLFTMFMYEN